MSWTLTRGDVGYYDNAGRFAVENGRINVCAGNTSSSSDNHASFRVTGDTGTVVTKVRKRR